MKKLLAILMSMIMIVSLTACAGGGTTESKTDSATTESTPTSENSATEGEPAATTTEGKKAKISLLISGNLGDMSFNDSANRGVLKAQEELGSTVNVIECNSDVSKFEPTLLDAADSGADIIIASSSFTEFIQQYAQDYPETTFVLFDDQIDFTAGEFSNVYCIMYKNNEGAFLGGYLAAEMTKSGAEGYNPEKIISFLGGQDQPVINDFLIGYIEGALYADPETKVAISYSNSFSDSAKGKELSLSMFNQGSDIGFNVAGGAGTGLIEAAAETKHFVLGVDSDQAMVYKDTKPEFANIIPTSILKNVDKSLFDAIELYQKGELVGGQTVVLGIKEQGVGVAENEFYQQLVPEDIRTKMKDLEAKIAAGEIEISSAYGMPSEKINEIRNSVKP